MGQGLQFVSETETQRRIAIDTNKRAQLNNSTATCQLILLLNSILEIPQILPLSHLALVDIQRTEMKVADMDRQDGGPAIVGSFLAYH